MQILDISEITTQVSHALDFTLSHLIADFNTNFSTLENASHFSKVALGDVTTHRTIPYVSGTFNGIQIMEKQRTYSFVGYDFFETASVEDVYEIVNAMSFYLNLAILHMKNLRDTVEAEVQRVSNVTPEDFPQEVVSELNKISFTPSTYAKTILGSFIRLYFLRAEGAYSDGFYQDTALKFDIQFDGENIKEIKKLN